MTQSSAGQNFIREVIATIPGAIAAVANCPSLSDVCATRNSGPRLCVNGVSMPKSGALGRHVESDPIGLDCGISTNAYVVSLGVWS